MPMYRAVAYSKMKSLGKRTWGIIFILAVVTLLLSISRNSSDPVTFRFIDRYSRRPLTNVVVESSRRWIALPLEKLKLRGIDSWQKTRNPSHDGSATINVPRHKNFYVNFESPGYLAAELVQQSGSMWIHYRSSDAIRQRTKAKALIIELDPEIQGPEPFETFTCIESQLLDKPQPERTNDVEVR
jgi:hypothetical protein